MSEGIYKNIAELKAALDNQVYDLYKVAGFSNTGELFIMLINPDTDRDLQLFNAYYGSHNACADICKLLGISVSEK